MVCKKKAVDKLIVQNRAKHLVQGPVTLTGVGEKTSVCEYGRYQVILPLHDKKMPIWKEFVSIKLR